MAVFLKNHKQKPTVMLSQTERRIFVAITLLLVLAVVWKINDSAHQNQALKPLTQYQYQFNQACQQSLNAGEDRNNRYCLNAQHFNSEFTQALKDQRVDLSESVKLSNYFRAHYRDFSNH